METRQRGPNAATIADGYSLSDERKAVSGPDVDFNYDDKGFAGGGVVDEPGQHDQEHQDPHVPHPDGPRLHKSHIGEHRGDFGSVEATMTNKAYIWALCAAVNSCNLGYDIGVNTGAGPLVQDRFQLSDLQLEIFFGSLNLFAMVGALLAHYVSDIYGRRSAFTFAAINFIIGVVILAVAQGYVSLMFGRVFVGLGVGFGLALDPLYIAEITPAFRRGELVTWSEIATNVGIVLGFLSGLIFSGISDAVAWRYMFALGAILPCAMLFFSQFVMAESPRWLILKGQRERATKVLQEIYGKNYDVQPIVLDMQDALEREAEAGKTMGWDLVLFPPPAFRRMLMVGVGVAIAQQAVGIDAIQYFLIFILEEAGVRNRGVQTSVLVFLGVVKLLFIFVGGKLFDRKGRRPLIFASLCGMAAALLMLSVNFFGGSHSASFSIFALSLYLAMFSLGMGPGAWLIPSEVFATCIRAKAMSVATFMNRVVATLMASTFLTTAGAMSWAGFFLMLAVVCLIILIYLYFILPETKGRSLEDMSVYFAELTGDRSVLEAEARIAREREAKAHAEITAPRFEPPQARELPPEIMPDAKVSGTMA